MELLLFKTKDQLLKEGISRLEKTAININGSAGKICRLYLNLINDILGDTYEVLRINHVRAFLSTADNDAIDSIGVLLNCPRNPGESDNDYKYRISVQTLSLATANETSIRLAALSVSGVQSVVMTQYTYGTGSYSVYVVSEFAVTPSSIIESVRAKIKEVNGFGIKYDVLTPNMLEVEMNVIVSFSAAATDADKTLILSDAKTKIIRYINTKNMGDILSIKGLTGEIENISTLISNVLISTLRINDRQVFVIDQTCRWNQRFLVSSKPGAINVQAV